VILIGRGAPITVKERAYNSLRRLRRRQMPSKGHLPFEALARSRSKRGPPSHPYPGSGGWSRSLREVIGISRNAVVASGETGSRRGSEWWGILKESDPRRVTVETDDVLRRMTAGRPGNGSVSEFEFLWGRRGGSGVKRAWWRYSAAIEDEVEGNRRRERRAGAVDHLD